jgi:hypothetical protein
MAFVDVMVRVAGKRLDESNDGRFRRGMRADSWQRPRGAAARELHDLATVPLK